MPQAGVSMSRGRMHDEPVGRGPATEERLDDHPYTGPLPVRAGGVDGDWEPAERAGGVDGDWELAERAGGVDGDWELAERAVAASPRPTRSAPRPAEPRPPAPPPAARRPTRSARPASVGDDRESLRNARAAIASWEQSGRAPIDSWDVPSRTRPPSAQESRPRSAAAATVDARPDGAVRPRTQAPEPQANGSATGMVRAPRPTPLPRSAMTGAASSPAGTGAGIPGRRTVQIQGRGTERYNVGFERRRPARRAHERDGFRPDRAAMWAVLLGFVLVLVAATSSHAAVLAHHIH